MSDRSWRFEKAIVLVVLCGSVGLNAVLANRLARLIKPVAAAPGYLAVGEKAPSLKLLDTEGMELTVDFAKAPVATVLYVMSPSCPWCARNRPNVVAAEAATRDRFRWIAITPTGDGVPELVAKQPPTFPLFVATEDTRSQYRLRTLPETIVIGKNGVVLQNWGGAYGDDISNEVERYFEIKLPGLLTEAAIRVSK